MRLLYDTAQVCAQARARLWQLILPAALGSRLEDSRPWGVSLGLRAKELAPHLALPLVNLSKQITGFSEEQKRK